MGGELVKCPSCRNRRKAKSLPYGAKRTTAWCDGCDKDRAPPLPNKKRERQRVKREIEKQQTERTENDISSTTIDR